MHGFFSHPPEQERNMALLASSLNSPAKFFDWGFVSISIPNLIMIGLIIILFALALIIPFPTHKGK